MTPRAKGLYKSQHNQVDFPFLIPAGPRAL